jgi:ribosome maturation factor RimP
LAILQTMEKTDLCTQAESFIQDLGAQILFWRENEARSGIKVELTLFSPSGVSMDLIEKVYRLLLPRLEALAGREVSLDISSPGVNRTLKSLYELPFFKGRELSLTVNGLGLVQGLLLNTTDKQVLIQQKDGKEVSVAKEQITQAKLI